MISTHKFNFKELLTTVSSLKRIVVSDQFILKDLFLSKERTYSSLAQKIRIYELELLIWVHSEMVSFSASRYYSRGARRRSWKWHTLLK